MPRCAGICLGVSRWDSSSLSDLDSNNDASLLVNSSDVKNIDTYRYYIKNSKKAPGPANSALNQESN